MREKSYDELAQGTKEIIDAAIILTEADRIFHNTHYDDARDIYRELGDTSVFVRELRKAYANDIQTTRPHYFNWHEDGAAFRDGAIQLLQVLSQPSMTSPELTNLVNHLENLPYLQQETAEKRGRG
jgi:hypothetical protein